MQSPHICFVATMQCVSTFSSLFQKIFKWENYIIDVYFSDVSTFNTVILVFSYYMIILRLHDRARIKMCSNKRWRKPKRQPRMENPETLATLDTQCTGRGQTKHKNITQKIKKMCNMDPAKNRGWIQVLAKGKQFLLHIKHMPCYSYIQSNPLKVLTAIGERKYLRKK